MPKEGAKNMATRQFKAESKRLLDLMINSIYTNKEIFLRELLSNASDAIDKIYYVALTDENISFNQSDYYIKIAVDKENRILTIADTGIGMDPEDLTHAFERFYRADKARSRATGGMGLGLSIARSIVESHGGTVFARARSGGSGTVIEIAFPNPE